MNSKMRTLSILALGFILGGFTVSAFGALDRGYSEAYGNDIRLTLESENRTMRTILLHMLAEKPAGEIRSILKDADVFSFDKSDNGSGAGNIFFVYENNRLIDIETTMTDLNVSQGDE